MDNGIVLMDSERIGRSVQRMAYEIAERYALGRPLLLFGIGQGGYALASMLSKILVSALKEAVEVVQLQKDSSGEALKHLKKWDEKPVIIVLDDVIFSGQTMFGALTIVTDFLQPSEIHTAVLIDRGHRKFPVEAEVYGMKLPTKLNEHVSVVIKEGYIREVCLHKFRSQ